MLHCLLTLPCNGRCHSPTFYFPVCTGKPGDDTPEGGYNFCSIDMSKMPFVFSTLIAVRLSVLGQKSVQRLKLAAQEICTCLAYRICHDLCHPLTYLAPDVQQAVDGAAGEAGGVGWPCGGVRLVAATVCERHCETAEATCSVACSRTVRPYTYVHVFPSLLI